MGLSKHYRPLQLALTAGLLLGFVVPPSAFPAERLETLKEKMADLQGQVTRIDRQRKNLSLKESQLTKKVNSLKKDSGAHPGMLANLRLENLLKELRENLLDQRRSDGQRALLQQQISKIRDEIDLEMENEIGRLIQAAHASFKKGLERDADRSYQEALVLMEEHKKFQADVVQVPAVFPSLAQFVLDGKESREKLGEIADFATHDQENLEREIKTLQENKARIQEEIALRRNLIKYPGLLERGENPSPLKTESVQAELIQFEKKDKILENQILKARETDRALSLKIQDLKRRIETREP